MIDRPEGAGAITVGKLEMDPGRAFRLHRHKVEEAVLVIEGQARFTLGDEFYDGGPETLMLLPAGMPHNVENIGQNVLRIIFFYPAVNVEREWLD